MANGPGYISVHRKIQEHWVWDDPERLRAWLDILLNAQFAPSEKMVHGTLIKVPRGTWFISQRKLQTRWGWSRTKVFMFLDTLESEQMISIKKTTHGSLIKVLNYELYQTDEWKKKTTNHTTDHTTNQTTDHTTDQATDWATDQTTEVQRNNKGNKVNKVNKRKNQDPLSAYTFSEEEVERLDKLGDEKAFPNQEIADLYWRKVLQIERGQIERPH